MATLEGWQIFLIVLAGILALLFIAYQCILCWATRAYAKMVEHNTISVDDFVNEHPTPSQCLKCVLLNRFNVGKKIPSTEILELRVEESDKVDGLKVTFRSDVSTKQESAAAKNAGTKKPPLVVGTIRMGFGHHRIAYAATSWGLGDASRDVYFHDLLNIESEEANMIQDTDKMYSKFSRIASEWGGPIEKLWGSLTLSGDADSLRVTCQMAHYLSPIVSGLDKKSPIVASHSLVAAAAVAAGYENVINLVIDNYAQWFTVVPGALNLVQGPTNYHNFLKMGIPPSQLQLAGHWIPKELVDDIPTTCQWRIQRRLDGKPVRVLIPVGGAGAQRSFVCKLVAALAPMVKFGKVQLLLNAGDHAHMKQAFEEVLHQVDLEYSIVPDMAGVKKFRQDMVTQEPDTNVTLFAFDEYFTAVATTDILCNVSDVLACKPSELAFYPIPKLMIRRVGDHEQFSALRASELGDGTLEAREIEDCLEYVELFMKKELLTSMNEMIVKNNQIGIYDGCKNAIRIALQRAEEMSK
jgi:hypothetical protein